MSENAMDLHAIGFREGAAHMHKALAARIAKLEAALRAIKRGAVWNADIEVFISAALEDRT